MTRRVVVWLVATILAVGVLAVWGAWTVRLRQEHTSVALQLEAERQRNFMGLVRSVQNIQGLLAKGLAAGSVSQNMLYMGELYRQSTTAVSHFMALPMPGQLSASTGKFLNQVGDFAYSIARHEAAGRAMSEQQRTEMRRLQDAAENLAVQLQQIGMDAARNGHRWTTPAPTLASVFTGWRRPAPDLTQSQAPVNLLPGGMDQVGPMMDRLPAFTYDGPFSDHLEKRAPAVGGAMLSEADARTKALAYLPNGTQYTVIDSVKVEGRIPAFSFRLAPASAARGARPVDYTVTVDVTQAGGHLTTLLNARQAGNPTLDLNRAKELGLAYLRANGYGEMTATYGITEDGFATVQYAAQQDGVILYPDQVKLRIALDNGEVVGVDARQYVLNHKERPALEKPGISPEEAKQALNPDLEVERVQLALIPTEAGDGEILAYEFTGALGDDLFLVYVNAQTGHEERILQVLLMENGTLAL